jgi:hypothetical protein
MRFVKMMCASARYFTAGKAKNINCLLLTNEKTRNALQHNIEARLYSNCCSGKSVSITFSECVSVTLIVQHLVTLRHMFICCCKALPFFFQIIS